MGEDLTNADCSWKKMVIAKTEYSNEWISTIKTERIDGENLLSASHVNSTNDSFRNMKSEREGDTSTYDKYEHEQSEDSETLLQEVDPLTVQVPGRRRRRKGSGPKPETLEERAIRLAKMSAYAAQRLANETPEQRASRLKRMSEYAAKRLSRETSEQRAKRLARMSAYAAKRLAQESPEQRQARLARMSAYAAKRHSMKKGSTPSPSSSDNLSFEYNSQMSNIMMPDKS